MREWYCLSEAVNQTLQPTQGCTLYNINAPYVILSCNLDWLNLKLYFRLDGSKVVF